nr:YlxR family protein [Neomicrococcus lactis]
MSGPAFDVGRFGVSSKVEPRRTCIGCRVVESQQSLMRWVLEEAFEEQPGSEQNNARGGVPQVVADPDRRKSGRGAWLHPTPECVALAVKKRAFARAFRTNVVSPPEDALNTAIAHTTTVRYESGSEN